MRRWVSSMFVAGLFVLVSAFAGISSTISPADAAPAGAITTVVAQPVDTTAPPADGPQIAPEQQPDTSMSAETKNKVWIAAIAVVLFGLVYLRNHRRYTKWRASKKG